LGIILVSMKKEEMDRVTGLETGADDYVTKPFSPRELLARIRAVLRRGGRDKEATAPSLAFNGWRFNLVERMLYAPDGEACHLPHAEYLILAELTRRAGEVCAKAELRALLQQAGYEAGGRSLDVLVSRVRRKLRDSQAHRLIGTAHGVGYTFRGRLE
jgi:DNA-binding response OmpR family regulator